MDIITKEKKALDVESGDAGYLDLIANIEENANTMTAHINDMTIEMRTMTDGFNKSSKAIEETGGASKAAFVRKEARKVAGYIESFSSRLKEHNKQYINLWNQVEKDSLELFENTFAHKEDSKQHIIGFVKSMKSMQLAIYQSSPSVEGVKKASLGNMGLERTLNQAIRFLDDDLKSYLDIMETIVSSIDRIIAKSKFLIGEIDFSDVSLPKEQSNEVENVNGE